MHITSYTYLSLAIAMTNANSNIIGYSRMLLISMIANTLLPSENETLDINSNRSYDSTIFSSRDMPHCRIPRPFKS